MRAATQWPIKGLPLAMHYEPMKQLERPAMHFKQTRPVDLANVHVFWKTLTVGDEERVHRVHEDSEMPNALRLIDESLEVIKKANPYREMFYAHAIHSLIHPESIEVEEPITRQR
ncbi:hypothetical protein Dimus_018930 [Dionaea muscipula]